MSERFNSLAANAVLGIDTLWGGDVMSVGNGALHRGFMVLRRASAGRLYGPCGGGAADRRGCLRGGTGPRGHRAIPECGGRVGRDPGHG
jgi:hypothetical protein